VIVSLGLLKSGSSGGLMLLTKNLVAELIPTHAAEGSMVYRSFHLRAVLNY